MTTNTKPSKAAMQAGALILNSIASLDLIGPYFGPSALIAECAAIIEEETGLAELRDALDELVGWCEAEHGTQGIPQDLSDILTAARAALARVNLAKLP